MSGRYVRQRMTVFCLSLVWMIAGCGISPRTDATKDANESYVPSAAQAEAALRAVCEAWRQDVPPGMIPGATPAVYITDTFRKPSEKLVDYRILGEVPSDRKRCIAVELRFEPERAERTRFLVVGIDPLWVFRQEDAENLAHWEHNMDTPITGQEAAPQTEASPTDSQEIVATQAKSSGPEASKTDADAPSSSSASSQSDPEKSP